MADKETWLSRIHVATHRINGIAYSLELTADAFGSTGNDSMAKYLDNIADTLVSCTKDITAAGGENLSEQIKRSDDMSISILNATLAGIKIATDDAPLKPQGRPRKGE